MKLSIDPVAPALDTPLRIRLAGAPPGAPVSLRATTRDPAGRCWAAAATFSADGDGAVDLTRDAPRAGSYAGVDPMGLVWSMTADPAEVAAGAAEVAAGAAAGTHRRLTVTATADGVPAVEAAVDRQGDPPGVAREVVSVGGLVGVLRYPQDGPPRPGVILIGGAEGGLHEPDAALLAAHGFAVLALAYFGAPGLPSGLVDIPLEYFGAAIEWLLADQRVTGDRVGVVGGSRGGEAALLIGSTFPAVGAVVSLVGSAVLTQGIPYERGALLDILRARVPSWTWRGSALPFLPCVLPPELERQVIAGEPVRLGLAFPVDDAARLAEHAIEVERIGGPVLMLSAEQDASWDAATLTEVGVARLARARHRFPFEHVIYPGAGHAIAPPPYGPTTELLAPGPGVMFVMGGSPPATAAARADQWRRTIAWFTEHLGR